MNYENAISVIVLIGGKVDKALLKKCLNSVKWAGEVIQVNTDNLKGSFSEWRNEGLKKAKGEWILYVDSDEEVVASLRDEIIQLVNKSVKTVGAYAIPRKNIIFNKEFKYSGQYPDYQKRLFKKTSLKKWVGDVHEEPVYDGVLGHLKNPLIHYKSLTISQMVEKTNKWSAIEARLLFDANHPPMNLFRFASVAIREFCKRMIWERAFLDGREGIIYALYQVFSRLVTYSKLWELQQKN